MLLLCRATVVLFGGFSIVWGLLTFSVFWQDLGVQSAAQNILRGHRYSTSALDGIIEQYNAGRSGSCRASTLQGVALANFSLVENALAEGDRARIDLRLTDLRRSVLALFACDPNGSFFWLAYYWANLSIDGYRPELLRFLRMSYHQGPNEGWIAIKRNRLALAVFSELPSDLSDLAVREFASIVSSGFVVDAAAILTGPGWSIRDRLLASLADVSVIERDRLASQLRERGYDVVVPGTRAVLRRPFESQ